MPPESGFRLLVLALLAAAAVAAALSSPSSPPTGAAAVADCPRALIAAGDDSGTAVCASSVDAVAAVFGLAARRVGCRAAPPGIEPAAGDRWRVVARADQSCAVRVDDMGGAARLALGLPLAIDQAGAADLARLPGVGPRLARAIVAARRERPFERVDDLRRVRGFGPGRLAALRRLLTVSGAPSPSPPPSAAP